MVLAASHPVNKTKEVSAAATVQQGKATEGESSLRDDGLNHTRPITSWRAVHHSAPSPVRQHPGLGEPGHPECPLWPPVVITPTSPCELTVTPHGPCSSGAPHFHGYKETGPRRPLLSRSGSLLSPGHSELPERMRRSVWTLLRIQKSKSVFSSLIE